ncbi:MAG: DUF748 domain-containing protein [Spongiibacteraceae bacterium]
MIARGVKVAKWSLVIMLVLVLLPELIRFTLIQAAPRLGFGEAGIEDVDFNLFDGTLAVKGLTLSRDGQQKLSLAVLAVDLSWWRLLHGEIQLQSLALDGTKLAVIQLDDGRWEVVIPLGAAEEINERVDATTETSAATLPKLTVARFAVSNTEVTLQSELINGVLTVDELVLSDVSSWVNEPATLRLDAHWNDTPLFFDLTATPLDKTPNIYGQIKLDGFDLTNVAKLLGQPLEGQLDVDVTVAASRNEQGAIEVVVDGAVAMLQLASSYQQLTLNSKALSWQGDIKLSQLDEVVSYAMQGDVHSVGLSVRDNEQQLLLLGWKDFKLNQLSLDQDLNLDIGHITVDGAELSNYGDGEPGRLYTGAIELKSLALVSGHALSVDAINLVDAQYDIVVLATGQLRLEETIDQQLAAQGFVAKKGGEADPVAAVEDSDVSAAASPLTLAIKKFEITGDSYIKLIDQRFEEPLVQHIQIKKLVVENLDQGKVDAPMTVTLAAAMGQFSSMELKGELMPFGEHLALNLKGGIESLELPDISGYSEAYMGYHLVRGQYDHQIEVVIQDNHFNMENKLFLRQLQLEAVDPNEPQPLARQLNMPLGLALDMLRDSDDNITLKVPIEGRLEELNVGLKDIISSALGNALRTGAASYLTLALQPYGAVLMAANYVGGKLSTIQLEPMVFEPGGDSLNAERRAYADKIVVMLKERPKLSLNACGNASEADKQALQMLAPEVPVTESQLVKLAERRGFALKRGLMDAGVESKRIYLCQPVLKADGSSAVNLGM